ncbi:MAG: glycosyltransferase, partial [Gammaproteobacteria bacterium]
FYERALCTVVPSRWPEPFGMVGVEAMARARPVVAFRAGGIPDWLDDGRTGHLVPEADTGAMAAAMAGLIHDRERAGAMGLQGRQTVDERFSHGHYLDAMMTLLSSATRSHGATP